MTHTLQSIIKDFEKYCKEHNHTTNAPPCEEFFSAMQYSRWQLQKKNISWKAFITGLGFELALPRYAGKEVRPYRQKGLEKEKNLLQSKCGCGSMYLSPVDRKGVKINYRCDACKLKSANKEDYGGIMGETLYNVVPEEGEIPRDLVIETKGRLY